ncbi:hypothetical protein HPP92_000738 [Vanilla planifolia]|uniref:Uncharacterized protein n=1 Tax=Vanilla planifolia TaxID=51239 RepID=A0A835VH22_VANPL|nr:hypothetical protein HPP92_000872 [Vanilla planifolia]KAG0500666.1 hypothetical protein HPP92_000738 [Vanilla planifolia]
MEGFFSQRSPSRRKIGRRGSPAAAISGSELSEEGKPALLLFASRARETANSKGEKGISAVQPFLVFCAERGGLHASIGLIRGEFLNRAAVGGSLRVKKGGEIEKKC